MSPNRKSVLFLAGVIAALVLAAGALYLTHSPQCRSGGALEASRACVD